MGQLRGRSISLVLAGSARKHLYQHGRRPEATAHAGFVDGTLPRMNDVLAQINEIAHARVDVAIKSLGVEYKRKKVPHARADSEVIDGTLQAFKRVGRHSRRPKDVDSRRLCEFIQRDLQRGVRLRDGASKIPGVGQG